MIATNYSLALAFDTNGSEFTRGVEIGMLYERADRDPEPFEQLIHASNAEMALRIGEATRRHVWASELPDTDTWMVLHIAAAHRAAA